MSLTPDTGGSLSGSRYHDHLLISALGWMGGRECQRWERQLNRNEKTLCKLRTRVQGRGQGSSWTPCPGQEEGPAPPQEVREILLA